MAWILCKLKRQKHIPLQKNRVPAFFCILCIFLAYLLLTFIFCKGFISNRGGIKVGNPTSTTVDDISRIAGHQWMHVLLSFTVAFTGLEDFIKNGHFPVDGNDVVCGTYNKTNDKIPKNISKISSSSFITLYLYNIIKDGLKIFTFKNTNNHLQQ